MITFYLIPILFMISSTTFGFDGNESSVTYENGPRKVIFKPSNVIQKIECKGIQDFQTRKANCHRSNCSFDGLTPGSSHQCIIHFNGTNSTQNLTVYTLPARPANLKVVRDLEKPGGLIVLWYQEGFAENSECSVKDVIKSNCTACDESTKEKFIQNTTSTNCCICNIPSFPHFILIVTVTNQNGSNSVFQEYMPKFVQNVSVSLLESQKVFIQITEDEDSDFIDLYVIKDVTEKICFIYTSNSHQVCSNSTLAGCSYFSCEKTSDKAGCSMTVTNLLPKTGYRLNVSAYLCDDSDRIIYSEELNFSTLELEKPHNLSFVPNGTKVIVKWLHPIGYIPEANHYTVHLVDKVIFDAIENQTACDIKTMESILCRVNEPENTSAECVKVTLFWEYQAVVTLHIQSNISSTASIQLTTDTGEPGMVPGVDVITSSESLCNGQNLNSTTVCATWREICPHDRHGFLDEYVYWIDEILRVRRDLHLTVPSVLLDYKSNDSAARRFLSKKVYEVPLHIKRGKNYTFIVQGMANGKAGIVTSHPFHTDPLPPVVPDLNASNMIPKDKIVQTENTLSFVIVDTNFIFDDRFGTPKNGVMIITTGNNTPYHYNDTEEFKYYSDWYHRNEADAKLHGYRIRESSVENGRQTNLEVIIGNEDCTAHQIQFCNGPLEANEEYSVWIFVCNDASCSSVLAIRNKTAAHTNNIKLNDAVIVGIFLGIISMILICLLIYFFVRKYRREKSADIENIRPMARLSVKQPPIRRPMKLSNLEAIIEKKLRDDGLRLRLEFQDIQEQNLTKGFAYGASIKEVNKNKNRFGDIMAYDHSRVKLFEDSDGSDYINANYMPGYVRDKEFIATQGPLPHTINDFWRLVWEYQVPIIVMLTQVQERGVTKCSQYWPTVRDEENEYGQVIVKNTSVSSVNDYVISMFSVRHSESEESRDLLHFHYLKWPDMTADVTVDSMLEFVSMVRQHARPDRAGSILVHCSAGVGRTGTFIAIDYMMQFINGHKLDDKIDIFAFVLRMRQFRCRMVQAENQYILIHKCAQRFMERKRLQEREQGSESFTNQGMDNFENSEPTNPFYPDPSESNCSVTEEENSMNTVTEEENSMNTVNASVDINAENDEYVIEADDSENEFREEEKIESASHDFQYFSVDQEPERTNDEETEIHLAAGSDDGSYGQIEESETDIDNNEGETCSNGFPLACSSTQNLLMP